VVRVQMKNTGTAVSLMNKLTLMNTATGERILPAYYSDNYVSLLPGEVREISIEYPADDGGTPEVGLRGWNLAQTKVAVGQTK